MFIPHLIHGDCLEVMADAPDASVDMILCDLPYGTTQCKWDAIIPFEQLWIQYKRLIRGNGAIVLTAAQPFTSVLISSNLKWFKYAWVWDKVLPRGHLNAKKQPMRVHEDIAVFSNGPTLYNPQKTTGHKRKIAHTKYSKDGDGSQVYGKEQRDTHYDSDERYPKTIIEFSTANQHGKQHPTQKPVALMEYMIRTYTNPGGVVLDNCMGSGTTGVACKNAGREFIGIEMDKTYFDIATARICAANDNSPASVAVAA
jgi:site-specific DNA-methyltransferase (adenine-specific)